MNAIKTTDWVHAIRRIRTLAIIFAPATDANVEKVCKITTFVFPGAGIFLMQEH
jgi:hypothetical protein